MSERPEDMDLRMDAEGLYQEEVFTDRQVGTIMRMTPVTRDGGPDTTRPVIYVGQTQLMTPMGSIPISFEIDAASLKDAAAKFADAAGKAVEETMDRLKELRREAASSIVVPGQSGGLGGIGGVPGGKLKMP